MSVVFFQEIKVLQEQASRKKSGQAKSLTA